MFLFGNVAIQNMAFRKKSDLVFWLVQNYHGKFMNLEKMPHQNIVTRSQGPLASVYSKKDTSRDQDTRTAGSYIKRILKKNYELEFS